MAGTKRELERLRTKPIERNWAMTRMGLGTGVRAAGHVMGNLFRDSAAREDADRAFYNAEAERLVAQLGELKGSVMKAGQMLSLYGQYFMPPEAVDILAQLQDDTDHVGWHIVGPVVDRALGPERMAELEIETRPLAAASLGQVHHARKRGDERPLVAKIRYPGVDEAIDSDIRTIARLLALSRLVPKDLSLDPVLTEVREMLHREVDYVHECEMLQRFRGLLDGDARFVVPEPLPRYSSSELLVMTYEEGVPVKAADLAGVPEARRVRLAQAALWLFLQELFVWHLVQTDPHFGNYRLRLDPEGGADPDGAQDQWVLLDFGATRSFPPTFVRDYARIVRGALEGEREQVIRGAVGIGLMRAHFPENVKAGFYELTQLITEPFRGGDYDWGASDLPARVSQSIARNALTRHFKIPPREIVFLHRRLAGVFITLARLDVRFDGRPLLEEALSRAEAIE